MAFIARNGYEYPAIITVGALPTTGFSFDQVYRVINAEDDYSTEYYVRNGTNTGWERIEGTPDVDHLSAADDKTNVIDLETDDSIAVVKSNAVKLAALTDSETYDVEYIFPAVAAINPAFSTNKFNGMCTLKAHINNGTNKSIVIYEEFIADPNQVPDGNRISKRTGTMGNWSATATGATDPGVFANYAWTEWTTSGIDHIETTITYNGGLYYLSDNDYLQRYMPIEAAKIYNKKYDTINFQYIFPAIPGHSVEFGYPGTCIMTGFITNSTSGGRYLSVMQEFFESGLGEDSRHRVYERYGYIQGWNSSNIVTNSSYTWSPWVRRGATLKGATPNTNGEQGFAPTPTSLDYAKVLTGDGEWSLPAIGEPSTSTTPIDSDMARLISYVKPLAEDLAASVDDGLRCSNVVSFPTLIEYATKYHKGTCTMTISIDKDLGLISLGQRFVSNEITSVDSVDPMTLERVGYLRNYSLDPEADTYLANPSNYTWSQWISPNPKLYSIGMMESMYGLDQDAYLGLYIAPTASELDESAKTTAAYTYVFPCYADAGDGEVDGICKMSAYFNEDDEFISVLEEFITRPYGPDVVHRYTRRGVIENYTPYYDPFNPEKYPGTFDNYDWTEWEEIGSADAETDHLIAMANDLIDINSDTAVANIKDATLKLDEDPDNLIYDIKYIFPCYASLDRTLPPTIGKAMCTQSVHITKRIPRSITVKEELLIDIQTATGFPRMMTRTGYMTNWNTIEGDSGDPGIHLNYTWSDWKGESAASETFTGATATTDGTKGLVPAPEAGDQSKVVTGDGNWTDPVIGETVDVLYCIDNIAASGAHTFSEWATKYILKSVKEVISTTSNSTMRAETIAIPGCCTAVDPSVTGLYGMAHIDVSYEKSSSRVVMHIKFIENISGHRYIQERTGMLSGWGTDGANVPDYSKWTWSDWGITQDLNPTVTYTQSGMACTVNSVRLTGPNSYIVSGRGSTTRVCENDSLVTFLQNFKINGKLPAAGTHGLMTKFFGVMQLSSAGTLTFNPQRWVDNGWGFDWSLPVVI